MAKANRALDSKQKLRIEYAKEVIARDEEDYCTFDDYYHGEQAHPFVPASTTNEAREINRKAITNMMRLAVKIPSSLTYMEGYIRGKDKAPREWKVGYIDTGFFTKQAVIYTAALKYGQAFVGLENLGTGKPMPKIYATKRTAMIFRDPVNDIHPLYLYSVLDEPIDKENPGSAVYMDQEVQMYLTLHFDGKVVVDHSYKHGLPNTPAVRFPVELDDEGRVTGAIEPLVDFQDALNQAKRNLLLNNNYSAEKVRYAAGIQGEVATDENGNIIMDANGKALHRPMVLKGRFVQTPTPDARFGTMDETPADGFVAVMEQLIREFAVAAQLPPHALLGSMANLSAETLVAALGQTVRFVHSLRTPWGEAHRSLMRLIAIDIGEIAVDDEYEAEPQWRDMTDRTFSGVVDGLGKLGQMLGIPAEALVSWIPGITTGEMEIMLEAIQRAKEEAKREAMELGTPAAAARRERRPRPTNGQVDGSGATSAGGVA